MSVRAKFIVTNINRSMATVAVPSQNEGLPTYVQTEIQTITLTPVTDTVAAPENAAIWPSSVSGQIQLSGIDPTAGSSFQFGDQYYVDFTAAG